MGKRSGKHIPYRRCVVCRASLPQAELSRFYRTTEGRWLADPARRAGGRGAWLCRECANSASTKALRKFFGAQTDQIIGTLKAEKYTSTHHNSRMEA